MSEPIKVGDLVVVVKPKECCGQVSEANGTAFVVNGFSMGVWHCAWCGVPRQAELAHGGSYKRIETYRLKRIPPLSELEGQPTQEDMKEPA